MQVGVPYYPEHWPRERWSRDAQLMKEAGVSLVRLGEFAWSRIEPRQGQFNVSWLREAIDLFAEHGIGVILCTPTPTYPPWMHRKYPDIHQVKADGRVVEYGQRQDACKNHPGYRSAALRVTEYVARELGGHKNVVAWQTDNEFGCHGTVRCYCDHCEREFQNWLAHHFSNDAAAMNAAWGTAFWSQEYNEFSEVSAPRHPAGRMEGMAHDPGTQNPGLTLDFFRFSSDVQVSFQRDLIDIIREYSPDRPITHNFMGGFSQIDYYKLAADLDIVSWDNYPFFEVPGLFQPPSSFSHELMRGLKRKNIWVMEQASGPGGWMEIPPTTEPGRMRLWAFQTVARGTDMVSFFRWRTDRYGTEMFWHGILDHHGEPRRRYDELARFAKDMATLSKQAGDSTVTADYALVFDYETLWSYEIQPQAPSGFGYRQFAARIVDTMGKIGLQADVVAPGTDLSNYKLVVVPSLHLCSPELASQLADYVKAGGRLVLGPRSGVRDTENAIVNQVLPGTLTDLVGAEVEEYDVFAGVPGGHVYVTDESGGEYEVYGMADLLKPSSAASVLSYKGRYYTGTPAAVRNKVGSGVCYYLGTAPGVGGIRAFMEPVVKDAGLAVTPEAPENVEVAKRHLDGTVYRFYLNHADAPQRVNAIAGGAGVLDGAAVEAGATIELEAFGAAVIREG